MTDNLPLIFECFMTYNTPGSAKKHCESYVLETRQMTKMFSFLLLQMGKFRIAWLFHDGFHANSSVFHWAVHHPIAFTQVWSLTRRFKLVTEELWLH